MFCDIEPAISIIVPAHRDSADFRRCLSALTHADPPSFELIVVVDGDEDADAIWHAARAASARVAVIPSAGGPARARNIGARMARGDLLFFVDADVTIHRDAVARVADVFRGDGRGPTAIIGSYDDAPDAPNFLSQYRNLLHHYVHQTAREEASTFWGACGAIRRDVFLALGGFDEGYPKPSIEDIELGYRLVGAGHRIRLCKSLQVKHLKRWRAGSMLNADFLLRALPWTELILRDRRFVNDLNLKASSRVSVALTYGLLAALIGVGWWRWGVVLIGLFALGLLALNGPVYRFFWRKRGLRFMLQVIPWHWLYFLYSGLAFVIGFLMHHIRRLGSRRH